PAMKLARRSRARRQEKPGGNAACVTSLKTVTGCASAHERASVATLPPVLRELEPRAASNGFLVSRFLAVSVPRGETRRKRQLLSAERVRPPGLNPVAPCAWTERRV